ncbi:hypothetical protein IIC65_07440 [Candidatus Sumerlaeota bacterium]|nr:hypothetical protein [Candidatus Sumerlaeota bacterium]
MGILELIQQKAFLGREFLTWLWFRAEGDPVFQLPGKHRCEIEILGPLVLDANYGDARSTALQGDSPATSPEAATALREGKKLRRARLKISSDGVDWVAGIDGETLSISGLHLPRPGQFSFEELLRLRLGFMLEFETIFSELFDAFLEIRLDDKTWGAEIEKIQDWVRNK